MVNAGGAIVGLNELPGLAPATGTYNLIDFASGSGLSGLTFAGGAMSINQNGETLKLVGAVRGAIVGDLRPSQRLLDRARWARRGTRSSTAVRTGAARPTGRRQCAALRGHQRLFYGLWRLQTTRTRRWTATRSANSLTFTNTGAIGIAAGSPATSTLTIAGTGGSIAINVNPGAGATTITAPLAIGASQTWAEQLFQSLDRFGQRGQRRQHAYTCRVRHDTSFGRHRQRQRRIGSQRQRPRRIGCLQYVHRRDLRQRRHFDALRRQRHRQRHQRRHCRQVALPY